MSRVTCHMSPVTCHMSHVRLLFFFLQSGEASLGRVCYQRGLPRLGIDITAKIERKPLFSTQKILYTQDI